jgi:hypothetical protein
MVGLRRGCLRIRPGLRLGGASGHGDQSANDYRKSAEDSGQLAPGRGAGAHHGPGVSVCLLQTAPVGPQPGGEAALLELGAEACADQPAGAVGDVGEVRLEERVDAAVEPQDERGAGRAYAVDLLEGLVVRSPVEVLLPVRVFPPDLAGPQCSPSRLHGSNWEGGGCTTRARDRISAGGLPAPRAYSLT